MSESLQKSGSPSASVVIAHGGGKRSTLPSDWFVSHYRLAFPKYGQDRDYWPEVEAVLRETFLNGGDAECWRAACDDGRDAIKTPGIFSTLDGYRDRVAAKRQEAERKAYYDEAAAFDERKVKAIEEREQRAAEIDATLDEAMRDFRRQAFEMAHNQAQSQASRAQQLAAKTLRVIEWLNKSGIPREQFTVRQREAWDAIAKEGA